MTGFRCDGCGFEYDEAAAGTAGHEIVELAAELAHLLTEHGVGAAVRMEADVWSPLEYACHVRDVLLVQRERVLAARRIDGYGCEPMGREERVAHDGYAEQDPVDVARQLGDAARLFAHVLDRLGPADWDRTVRYGYPEPADRSLRWVAVHTLHEARHHLGDAHRGLR